jgi:hypothetical protein
LAEVDPPRHPHVLVDRLDKGLWVYEQDAAPEPVHPNNLEDRLGDPQTGEPTAPIVFKLHGSIDRKNCDNDTYLITEEDYADFLGRAQENYIPAYIKRLMAGKPLLFLGYSLEDWNVRIILSRLLRSPKDDDDRRNESRYWAVVRGRNDAEQRVWQAKNLRNHFAGRGYLSGGTKCALRQRAGPAPVWSFSSSMFR